MDNEQGYQNTKCYTDTVNAIYKFKLLFYVTYSTFVQRQLLCTSLLQYQWQGMQDGLLKTMQASCPTES